MCYGACTNCGNCRGETRVQERGRCFFCGADNDPSAETCAVCGKRLPKLPGVNNAAPIQDKPDRKNAPA